MKKGAIDMDGIDALREMQEGNVVAIARREAFGMVTGEYQYRLKNGKLQTRAIAFNPPNEEQWHSCFNTVEFFLGDHFWEVRETMPEFNLTFVEAFRAMLDGKKVSNKLYPQCVYYIEDGSIFGVEPGDLDVPFMMCISTDEQRAMWRVDRDLDSECVIDWPEGEGDD